MIEKIINELNRLLASTKIYAKNETLAVHVMDKNDVIQPMIYIAKGEYRAIDFDKHRGVSYWRKINMQQQEVENDAGCSPLIGREYMLRMVGIVKRTEVDCDSVYVDDVLSDAIIKVITKKHTDLRNDIGAQSLTMFVDEVITDNNQIESEEFIGKKIGFRHEYIYIAIDMRVTLTIDPICLPALCP